MVDDKLVIYRSLGNAVVAARMLVSPCRLCPRRCLADRQSGATGYCGVGHAAYYFDIAVHYGDEMAFIPNYAVSFSGCNLRCRHCITAPAAWLPTVGTLVDCRRLAREIAAVHAQGMRFLHLVGGEPMLHLPLILDLAQYLPTTMRILLDANFYWSAEAMPLLNGVVSDFLPDLKFGNDNCARRLADAVDYWRTVTANILAARAIGDTIVRHLLLPGHFDCCLVPVVEWMAGNCPQTPFSLRRQFVPCGEDLALGKCGFVSEQEYRRAVDFARQEGVNLVE